MMPLKPIRKMLFIVGLVCFLILAGGISVFAAVQPTPGIEIANEQMIIYEADRGFSNINLIVQDVMEIVNKGSEDQSSVTIPLAQGHQGLTFMEGPNQGQFNVGDESFTDTRPLKAGETRRYSFSYGLGYPALPNVIARSTPYTVGEMTVAVPEGKLSLQASGLVDKGKVLMGEVELRRYASNKALKADPDFTMVIDKGDRVMSPWLWVWIALFFVLPTVGLLAIRSRSAKLKNSRHTSPGKAPGGRRTSGGGPRKG